MVKLITSHCQSNALSQISVSIVNLLKLKNDNKAYNDEIKK